MFKRTKNEEAMSQEVANNSSNIIGKGTLLEGNLTTAGNLRVEGKIVGSVISKAKLVLGDTSFVKGNIKAGNAEMSGEVQGTIEVGGLLILKAKAIVQGDIITNKLVFEEGARFNGKCKMGTIEKSGAPLLKKDTTATRPLQNNTRAEKSATTVGK